MRRRGGPDLELLRAADSRRLRARRALHTTRPARPAQTLQLVFAARGEHARARAVRDVDLDARVAAVHPLPARSQWLSSRFGASRGDRARVVSYLRRVGATDVKVDATGLFADATDDGRCGPTRVRRRARAGPAGRATSGSSRRSSERDAAVSRRVPGVERPRHERSSGSMQRPNREAVPRSRRAIQLPVPHGHAGRVRRRRARSAGSRRTST